MSSVAQGKQRANDTLEYFLEVRQQPKHMRSAETSSRKLRAESPIIRVSARSSPSDEWAPPARTSNLMLFADLVRDDSDVELYTESASRTKWTCGSSVSSIYHFRDLLDGTISAHFVFPDLRPRQEGAFRYKLSMYELVDNGVDFCASIFTNSFLVSTRRVEATVSRFSDVQLPQSARPLKRPYDGLDSDDMRRVPYPPEPSHRPGFGTTAPFSTSTLLQYGRSFASSSTMSSSPLHTRQSSAPSPYRPRVVGSTIAPSAPYPASAQLTFPRDVQNYYPALSSPYTDVNRGFAPVQPLPSVGFDPHSSHQPPPAPYDQGYTRPPTLTDGYGLGRAQQAFQSLPGLSRVQNLWSQPGQFLSPVSSYQGRNGSIENGSNGGMLAPLSSLLGERNFSEGKESFFAPDQAEEGRGYS